MRPGRIIALVIGCLLVLPAIALLLGGSALGLAYAFGRGDDGYFDVTLDRLSTDTVAITAEDLTLAADPGSPDWVLDALDADVRLRVTSADGEREVFVGIARESDVDTYLSGVAHDELIDLHDGLEPVYRSRTGGSTVDPPTEKAFWAASATGPGTQQLDWEAATGRWAAVVMNADGTPAITADVNVGAKAAFVLPLALLMIGVGTVLTAVAVASIVTGASGTAGDGPAPPSPPPPSPSDPVDGILGTDQSAADRPSPVTIEAVLDPKLSRWLWLVKWILAIPHFIVLAFFWVAFIVVTVVAAVSILFTGRYPPALFDFNVGVLRWTWRVSHYATTGGIGTDQYPPFTLRADPADRARLDVLYPSRLSRGLVLVKWILAIPHLLIVGLLVGTSFPWLGLGGDWLAFDLRSNGGVLAMLAFVAGVMLLVTDRYPVALFDLIVGFNRWVYRVIAYVALMTDEYPPFRLDQGGRDASTPPIPPTAPTSGDVDLHYGSWPSDRVPVSS